MLSPSKMRKLEERVDYRFSDHALLTRALTHRSASLAMKGKHMERLEFLGDAVLGLVISEFLHAHFPDRPEGELSRMRSALAEVVLSGFSHNTWIPLSKAAQEIAS